MAIRVNEDATHVVKHIQSIHSSIFIAVGLRSIPEARRNFWKIDPAEYPAIAQQAFRGDGACSRMTETWNLIFRVQVRRRCPLMNRALEEQRLGNTSGTEAIATLLDKRRAERAHKSLLRR